jgi:hypothetical protein
MRVNTTAVVEEDLTYTDEEPEIVHVVPGTGWGVKLGERVEPVLFFCVVDTGRAYPVVVAGDGTTDINDDASQDETFQGIIKLEEVK